MLKIYCIAIASLVAVASLCQAESAPRSLTLAQAREIALKKHPKITVADLKALAAKQTVKQAEAAYYPLISANVGAVVSDSDKSRIVANPLTVSSSLNRASGALTVTQTITDFGRTSHLTSSSKLKAEAEERNTVATRAQIVLQVDSAYVAGLAAASLVEVAEDTVKTRQLVRDQIATLAKNKIKSELDASFAEVNLQEASLLLSRTQNDLASAYATLAALLDEPETTAFKLADSPEPGPLVSDVGKLISLALQNRPELQRLQLELQSAQEQVKADAALSRPTVGLQATAGTLPWRSSSLEQNFAAAGVVVSWPIFTGGLNTAKCTEADLKAQAATAALRDETNNVMRDVRLAWLAASNAHERVGITAKLLEQAKKTLSLAQARYDAGSSSIVELSQSQLNSTTAEITHTSARYDYLLRRSLLDYATGKMR